MSSTNNSSGHTGANLIGVIQTNFVILKLCGLISWSWPVVLIPMWIWIGLFTINYFSH